MISKIYRVAKHSRVGKQKSRVFFFSYVPKKALFDIIIIIFFKLNKVTITVYIFKQNLFALQSEVQRFKNNCLQILFIFMFHLLLMVDYYLILLLKTFLKL